MWHGFAHVCSAASAVTWASEISPADPLRTTRMTIFEDHLIRDINAGRYAGGTSLVLVTHGLALRVLLMRWFHWSVDQFMNVFNPPNAEARPTSKAFEEGTCSNHIKSWRGGPCAGCHRRVLIIYEQAVNAEARLATSRLCNLCFRFSCSTCVPFPGGSTKMRCASSLDGPSGIS